MATKKNQHPNLLDTTIKEGGLRVHHHILLEQVADITRELERSGIQYAEVSHGRGIGGKTAGYPGLQTDKDLLKTARQAAPGLKLCVYLRPYPYSLMEIEPLQELFDIGRVGANVHEVQKAKEFIERLKKFNKKVIVQLLRVHSFKPQEVTKAAKQLEKQGVDVIYLTDTSGSLTPEETGSYVSAVKKGLKIPVGFQGRNNTGQAMGNALAAFQAGAEWLDGSIMGMGPAAGTVNLEMLVSLLQHENLCQEIDLANLCNLGKFYVLPALRSLPFISYTDLLMAKHKLDYYPQEILEITAGVLEIELEDLLTGLRQIHPNLVQLKEEDLKNYLAKEGIDFEVFLEFVKTGKVPGFESNQKTDEAPQ